MSDQHRAEQKFNHFLHNAQSIPTLSQVPPPMPLVPPPMPQVLPPMPQVPPPIPHGQVNTRSSTVPNGRANTRTRVTPNGHLNIRTPVDLHDEIHINHLSRSPRRVVTPSVQCMSSAMNNGFGGAYNNNPSLYPYNRNYMNMNMGGFNPYNTFGSPMPNQYQNPTVIAAAENSRPAFESIQSVVQTFNAISMMLESTFTAMHMSFQALLGVAENFTRLRTFMMKLYSTAVSFKLARWFITKLFSLLKMVRGNSKLTSEEELWASLSSATPIPGEIIPSDGRSWPLVVFTGLLVATPYFVYKLLNSVTPENNPILPVNNYNLNRSDTPSMGMVFSAKDNWNSSSPNTLSLIKGAKYFTDTTKLDSALQNDGWILVHDFQGHQGLIPSSVFNTHALNVSTHPIESISHVTPEQIQPQPCVNNNPVVLSCPQDNNDLKTN